MRSHVKRYFRERILILENAGPGKVSSADMGWKDACFSSAVIEEVKNEFKDLGVFLLLPTHIFGGQHLSESVHLWLLLPLEALPLWMFLGPGQSIPPIPHLPLVPGWTLHSLPANYS